MRNVGRKATFFALVSIAFLALIGPLFLWPISKKTNLEAYLPTFSDESNKKFMFKSNDVIINSNSSSWDLGLHKYFLRFQNLKIHRNFFIPESSRILGINPYMDLQKEHTLIIGSKTALGAKFIQQNKINIDNMIELSSTDELYFTEDTSKLFSKIHISKIIVFFDQYLYHFATTNGAQFIENTCNKVISQIIEFQNKKDAQLTFVISKPVLAKSLDLDYTSNAHVVFVPNILDFSVITDLNNQLLQGMRSCDAVGEAFVEDDSYVEAATAEQVSKEIYKIYANFTRGRTEIKAKGKEETSSIIKRIYPNCKVTEVRNVHQFDLPEKGAVFEVTLEMENNMKALIQNKYLENYRNDIQASDPYMSFVIIWPMYESEFNKTLMNNFLTHLSKEFESSPLANFEVVYAAPSYVIDNLNIPKNLIENTQLISISNETLSNISGYKKNQITMALLNLALKHINGKFVCIIDNSVFISKHFLDMTIQEIFNDHIIYRVPIVEFGAKLNKENTELVNTPWMNDKMSINPQRFWTYNYDYNQSKRYNFGAFAIIVSSNVLKQVIPFDEIEFPFIEKILLNTLHKSIAQFLITEPMPFMYNSYIRGIRFFPPNKNDARHYYEYGVGQ